MGKRKLRRKLFETDLREVSPCMEQLSSWAEENSKVEPTSLKGGVEGLGFSWDHPRVLRVDSYRAPPLKLTLETIQEDQPKPDFNYLRSRSLPAERRASLDSCNGHGLLQRFPSYRAGQAEYLSTGSCGVSMSGPILPSTYDYDSAPSKKHRLRLSRSLSRMRESLRSSRFRQAVHSMLSRIRPASRRSHWSN
jgi:hypothetical protein